MKSVKRLLALVLALCMLFSFAACHKKDETAVTVGDVKFTAAMYSYALLTADSEARTKVDEALAVDTESATTTTDYFGQMVEDKPFITWVEDRAIELLSLYAAYDVRCRENNLTADSDTVEQIKQMADYYYAQYQVLYEANGIGKETYRKALNYENNLDLYFTFLYGKDGSKAVAAEEIEKLYNESYRAVFVLETDLSQMEKDEEKAAAKQKLEDIKARLEKGDKIVDIYNEFYGYTEGSGYESYAASEEIDALGAVADGEVDSNRGVDYWKDIKDLARGSIVVLEDTENKVVRLVKVMEAEADKTYIEKLDMDLRRTLKLEEFENEMDTFAKTLTVKKNSHGMKPFTVKKIKYPTVAQ